MINDPEFLPGSNHIAHCPVTNPTAKQWTYDAELYLVEDSTKYTSSGTISFTLAAGASATVDFPIIMPGSAGTYNVYLDIYVAGELIAAYQATEPVTVSGVSPLPEVPKEFCVDTITAEPSVVALGNEVKIHVEYWLPNGVDVRPYIGKTYQMHCTIDGETLTVSTGPIPYFPADIYFAYTPRSIGTYIAIVLDKSVSFEVRQEVVGVYYSPYGGYGRFSSIDYLANHINNNELGETTDCFQGNCWWIQHCPYCNYSLKAGYYYARNPSDTLRNVYGVLDHIQSSHPAYPLTKPRAHIEVTVPQLPSPVSGVWMSPQAYVVKVDGTGYIMQYHCAYEVFIGPCNTWVFNNIRLFAVMPGAHHIEVSGPCGTAYAQLGMPCGEVIFSGDVTLRAVGDKVTINVKTGLVGYEEWSVPIG